MRRLDEGIAASIKVVADRLQTTLNELTSDRGIQAALLSIDGPAAVAVPQYARYADLCILGQNEPEGPASVNYTFSEQLLFVTGRPVLFVPAEHSCRTLGRHIVVAWNSSRPAARSLNDAIPLIERADRTTVVMINPSDFIDSHEGPPGEQLAEHLTRHGATVDSSPHREHCARRDRRSLASRSARVRRRSDCCRRVRSSAAMGKDAWRRHARSHSTHAVANFSCRIDDLVGSPEPQRLIRSVIAQMRGNFAPFSNDTVWIDGELALP